MVLCKVCDKVAGRGTFLCTTCPGEDPSWVHPECGGYKRKYVQKVKDKSQLMCIVCKVKVRIQYFFPLQVFKGCKNWFSFRYVS